MVLVFLYAPLLLVVVNAFNSSRTFAFPPTGFTLDWWATPRTAQGCGSRWRTPRWSVSAPPRSRWCWARWRRSRCNATVLRPQHRQLPGGAADHVAGHRHRHRAQRDVHLGARHHARAGDRDHRARDVLHRHRLQQHPGPAAQARHHLEDASADLGATSWQTFRYITFPMMRGALVAGAILAFALSLRRDRGDHVHRRTERADPADLDLRKPVPPQSGARDQRGRRRADRLAIIPVWLAQRFGGDPATTRV